MVCDGDSKTFSKVTNVNPYTEIAPGHIIRRFECLAHMCKRLKGHLIEHQKNKIRKLKAEKQMRHGFAKFEGKRNMQKFEKALADEYRVN